MLSKIVVQRGEVQFRKPYMEIDKHLGARIKLVANMTVDFQGRSSMSQLLNATATMHVTVRLKDNKIKFLMILAETNNSPFSSIR